jgi:hypothetical protein
MIDLDELLGITGAIILVDVFSLELFWSNNLPEWWSQSTKIAPPWWGDIPHWETSWRGQWPCPTMPSIIDEVAEVFAVTIVLSQVAVLDNPPLHVIVG